MSPKKVEKEDVVDEKVEVLLPPALITAPVEEVKRITFKQFVAGKASIKPHHISGMKAFIGNSDKLRTPEQWEKLLEGY